MNIKHHLQVKPIKIFLIPNCPTHKKMLEANKPVNTAEDDLPYVFGQSLDITVVDGIVERYSSPDDIYFINNSDRGAYSEEKDPKKKQGYVFHIPTNDIISVEIFFHSNMIRKN